METTDIIGLAILLALLYAVAQITYAIMRLIVRVIFGWSDPWDRGYSMYPIVWLNSWWCWCRGLVAVPVWVERLAADIVRDEVAGPLDPDVILREVGDEKETRRRPYHRRQVPYVTYLVAHVRGEIGCREFSGANQLVVERHARAEAIKHGVRMADLAPILPLVVSTYFFAPSEAEVTANMLRQSDMFTRQVEAARANYSGLSGRNPLKRVDA